MPAILTSFRIHYFAFALNLAQSVDSTSSDEGFGGGASSAFRPGNRRESIAIYKRKDRCDQWEFTYDPDIDMALSARKICTG